MEVLELASPRVEQDGSPRPEGEEGCSGPGRVQEAGGAAAANTEGATGGGELRQRLAEGLPGSCQQRRGTIQVLSQRLGMSKTSCMTV